MGPAACAGTDAASSRRQAELDGDRFTESQQLGRAVEAYQQAVKADPDDGLLRVKLARAYQRAGRWDAASTEAARAADLLPNDLDVRLTAASLMLGVRRYEDAAMAASSVLRERPEDPQALVVLGNATARLQTSWWALFSLADRLDPANRFHSERIKVRPPVSREEDLAAEQTLRKAISVATNDEPRLALVNFLWAAGRLDESADLLRQLADRAPGDATLHHALGAYYVSRNRTADGEKYLRNAAATQPPQNRAPRWRLVNHYEAQHRDTEALAVLDAMLGDAGVFADASIRSAEIFWRQQKLGETLRRVDGLLARNPKEPRALAIKARVLYAAGNFAAAAATAKTALAVDPDSGGAHFALGQTLAATGRLDEAFSELREASRVDPKTAEIPVAVARLALATGRNDVALEYAREARRKQPDDQEPALAVVTALVRLQNPAMADRELAPLLTRYPESADVFVLLGQIREAQGRRPAARTAYQRAVGLNPGSLGALAGLVSLDLMERQIPAARTRVEQALARHPTEPGYLQLASRVYAAEGDLALAESTLRRALTVDSGWGGVALQLAEMLQNQNRLQDAVGVLEAALQSRPSATEVRTRLAVLLEAMGRRDEARVQYERVAAQDAGAALAAARLALLQVAGGANPDEPLRVLARARQRAPENPDVSHALGWVHLQSGRAAVAIPYLEEAARARPRDPTFLYVLGAAYIADKQPAKARDILTRALQLDAPFPDRDKARAALDALR
jgi:tetratricopeptide (TPR) repeat protein